MDSENIHLVLPAYNEEQGVRQIFTRLLKLLESLPHRKFSVVVVDDGSVDSTRDVVEEFANRLDLTIISHHVNRGLGNTLRDGLLSAINNPPDNAMIVTMDADDTHPIEMVPKLAQAIDLGADIVVASRFRNGSQVTGLSTLRRILSWGSAILMIALFPTPGLRDYTCGFRAYRKSVLRKAIALYGDSFFSSKGFQCPADILLKLRAMRPRPIFVEVAFTLFYERKAGASKMRILQTTIDTLSLILRRRCGIFN